MRFIASCSILGLLAGMLAAKAIQPASACDCIVSNPETADLALVSVTRTDSDEGLPDAERDRWTGTLSAEMSLSDEVWLAIESDGDAVTTLRFDPSAEEAP